MEEIDNEAKLRFVEASAISLRLVSMIETIDRCNTHAYTHDDRKIQAELAFLYPQLIQLLLRIRSRTLEHYRGPEGHELLDYFQHQCSAVSTIFSELESIDTTGELKNWAAEELHKLEQERAKLAEFEDTIRQVALEIGLHADVLTRVYRQTTFVDHFGLIERKKWDGEVQRFIDGIVEPALGKQLTPNQRLFACGFIDDLVSGTNDDAAHDAARDTEEPNVDAMSPLEYEAHCASALRLNGWEAALTPPTGDQGADVIASRNGTKMVVQCKKYSTPVGNDAVQQVIAAMAFQDADVAVVISNAAFTPAARRLAAKTNVRLIHHSEIGMLEE